MENRFANVGSMLNLLGGGAWCVQGVRGVPDVVILRVGMFVAWLMRYSVFDNSIPKEKPAREK